MYCGIKENYLFYGQGKNKKGGSDPLNPKDLGGQSLPSGSEPPFGVRASLRGQSLPSGSEPPS